MIGQLSYLFSSVLLLASLLAPHPLVQNQPPPARPVLDAVPPVKRIEVILSSQRLIGWEGERKVFDYAVTTGQEEQPTISGEYEILDKEQDAYSYGWALTLPFWLGVYQLSDYENGFHALPMTDDGEELWRDALGNYPASHGCIVLAPEEAEALFNWAEVGTQVVIHD